MQLLIRAGIKVNLQTTYLILWFCSCLKLDDCFISTIPRRHQISKTNTWWRHQMETFSASLASWRESTGDRWIPFTKASDEELFVSLICAWANGWANNWDAGDLRRLRAHYDVTADLPLWTQHLLCYNPTKTHWMSSPILVIVAVLDRRNLIIHLGHMTSCFQWTSHNTACKGWFWMNETLYDMVTTVPTNHKQKDGVSTSPYFSRP